MDFKMMKISFCERMADNVVTADSKKYILDLLKNNHEVSIQDKYALVVNDKNIKYLKMNPHLITIKTAGSNYYLFMTRINDVNCCFFIDRKIKQGYSYPRIISVKYRFSDDVFNDTLLDGELVKDRDNNWMFLINNLILFKGEKLKCNIVSKFNKLYKMFKDDYTYDSNMDICPLIVKKIFTYEDYDKLLTGFIPSLTYQLRGLYFNTLNTKHANFLFLTSNSNNQSRPQKKSYSNKKNTSEYIPDNEETNNQNNKYNNNNKSNDVEKSNSEFVFQLRKTMQPEIYDLYGMKNGNLEKVSVAYISGLRCSKKIKSFFKESDDPVNVECKYVEKFSKYEPLKISQSNITEIKI